MGYFDLFRKEHSFLDSAVQKLDDYFSVRSVCDGCKELITQGVYIMKTESSVFHWRYVNEFGSALRTTEFLSMVLYCFMTSNFPTIMNNYFLIFIQ